MADPTAADDGLEKLHLSIPYVMHNVKVIEHIRGFLSIMAGAATGILGITGLKGFVVFLGFYILTSLAIMVKMKGNVSAYTPMRWPSFLVADAASHALSFTLFWTMLYTLVYIY